MAENMIEIVNLVVIDQANMKVGVRMKQTAKMGELKKIYSELVG